VAATVPLENLYDKTKSMYKLVILASMRALELNAGATHLAEVETDKVAQIALKEIEDEKISYKNKKASK